MRTEKYPQGIQAEEVVADQADGRGTGNVRRVIVNERRRVRVHVESAQDVLVRRCVRFQNAGLGGVEHRVKRITQTHFFKLETRAQRPVRKQSDRSLPPHLSHEGYSIVIDYRTCGEELSHSVDRSDEVSHRRGKLVVIELPAHEHPAKRTSERRPEDRVLFKVVPPLNLTGSLPVVVSKDAV